MIKHNDEVYFAEPGLVRVREQEIAELKRLLGSSGKSRIRLCAHVSPEEKIHEMFIVMRKDVYVRPHKHRTKTESFHVLEGAVDIVLFDEQGAARDVIRMGDYASGRCFYYRMPEPRFHTLLLRSDYLVFQEVGNGPFDRADTLFAPWAPADNDSAAGRAYLGEVARQVERLP